MSERTKAELRLGIVTVLIAIAGSLAGTIWYSASVVSQVEANTRHLERIDAKIQKLTEYLLGSAKGAKDAR